MPLLSYGVATISRLREIIGLFYKRALYKRRYFAKETYNLKEPSNRSHPMAHDVSLVKFTRETEWAKSQERQWAMSQQRQSYEVATISRLPKNIGLFCKRALQKRLYSATETYMFKEPTNHSHSICHNESCHKRDRAVWHRDLLP